MAPKTFRGSFIPIEETPWNAAVAKQQGHLVLAADSYQ